VTRLSGRLLEGERRLIGWYLYYARAGGASEVVQIAARNGSFGRLLQRLLVDAWRHGAAAVRGASTRATFGSFRIGIAGSGAMVHGR
jgi:hypothetical protein